MWSDLEAKSKMKQFIKKNDQQGANADKRHYGVVFILEIMFIMMLSWKHKSLITKVKYIFIKKLLLYHDITGHTVISTKLDIVLNFFFVPFTISENISREIHVGLKENRQARS